jgi:hypothetical protein
LFLGNDRHQAFVIPFDLIEPVHRGVILRHWGVRTAFAPHSTVNQATSKPYQVAQNTHWLQNTTHQGEAPWLLQ